MDTKKREGAAGDAAPVRSSAVFLERTLDTKPALQHQELVRAALEYVKLGWRPLPVLGKRPALRGWAETVSTEPSQVCETFARARYADGIAVATGAALFVIDLDRKPGANGIDSFAALVREHGALPKGARCRTPSGGVHMYFRAPPQVQVRTAAAIAPGVDVRGERGLAVVAPTRREAGAYVWSPSPWEAALPEAPPWLLEMVAIRQPISSAPRPIREFCGDLSVYAAAALRSEAEAVAAAAAGARNSTLFRAAAALGELAGAGILSVQAIEAALENAARACGLADDDGPVAISRTIASGLQRGLANPRAIDGGSR